LVACRYHGLNQHQPVGTLARSEKLSPRQVAQALDNAEPVPSGGVFNCPADFGEVVILRFDYASGPAVLVKINATGCKFATDGEAMVWTPGALQAQLAESLGLDTQS
jgi:hypothetical protein